MKKSILILVLTLASFTFAQAHAFLDHADPRVGSTIHESPAQVKLWMTEDLEGAFSRIQVFNAAGGQVDKTDTAVSSAIMTVSLPKLSAGTYRVAWTAVATDTHKTSGTFSFTIQ